MCDKHVTDRASSCLGTICERQVQAALERLQQMQRRTTLVIAHRLSTIRNADKTVVVADGRIIEAGTHEELLMLRGAYAALCTESVE